MLGEPDLEINLVASNASKQEDGEEEVLRLVLSDERTLHLVLTV